MATFKPTDFGHVVAFGKTVSDRNQYTGASIAKFVQEYKLHFATQKRTITQQYMVVGTRLENTITIITRHDVRNDSVARAQINGIDYEVLSVSPDDSNEYIRYDYLTLSKITSGGGANNG
ncbi:phage head closure protein [Lacticaseibacillus pantheris]|nr:phage head closure protein [Lacticaseibacillus pantheris]WKF86021.1 phage head closure protein [Lacticaseibacillus pantheris]